MYGEQQKSHAESIIPIVLILILSIFVLAKFGVIDLSGVPVVGELFGKTIKVALIGHVDPKIQEYLHTSDAVIGARIQTVNFADDSQLRFDTVLDDYDILIVQNIPVCSRAARKTITNKVKAGGRMIIIGDACTQIEGDDTVYGWDIGIHLMGDVMPAKIGGVTHERIPVYRYPVQGKMLAVDMNHPLFNGYKEWDFTSTVFEVFINDNGKLLATFETTSSSGKPIVVPAILESSSMMGLGGKVLYFAFNPADLESETMFLNAMLYLKNKQG